MTSFFDARNEYLEQNGEPHPQDIRGRDRSPVTLEPMPTLKEAVSSLLNLFLDNNGYGDLFDLKQVLFSSKPEELGKELICQVDEMNEESMISEGLCPYCGHALRIRTIPGSWESPEEKVMECPQCLDRYRRVS